MKIKLFPENGEIVIKSIQMEFSQTQDDASEIKGQDQSIEIWIEDAGAGPYFCIKTSRWAFDDLDQLIKIIEKFKSVMES
jgi:hypothetical protein